MLDKFSLKVSWEMLDNSMKNLHITDFRVWWGNSNSCCFKNSIYILTVKNFEGFMEMMLTLR